MSDDVVLGTGEGEEDWGEDGVECPSGSGAKLLQVTVVYGAGALQRTLLVVVP